MKSLLGRLLLIGSLLTLAACTTAIRSNVATFHDMTVPGGERVMITPMLPEKSDSLEFQQYAGVLAGHLQRYGYKQPGDADPELIAGFDVTINDGREKLENRLSPYPHRYWAHGYWVAGRYWRPIHPVFYDPFHEDTEIVARTVYTATLTFELRTPDGEKVFEGRAETETRRKDLPQILPYLAAALFESFPGENGVTRRVSIEREKPAAE